MSSIIEVKKLRKEFVSGKKLTVAVDEVSFGIEKGSITGLLGPNGAGKTTTIQMLLNIITPTSGKIRILGKDMLKYREDVLSQINFSSPYVSMPLNLTVWENLATFARLYGVRNVRDKVKDLVEMFEITDLLHEKAFSLSTGQMTRLNLAKAFLNDPKVLLLDEATASLDPDIADKTRKMLKSIQKERDITMLYTSHNMAEIEELCDRVIFLQKGKIIDDDTPKKVIKKYGRKDLNEVFLDIARNTSNL